MATVIGVDVGGTFTDVVLFDDARGAFRVEKVPTTPNQADGFVRGLEQLGVPFSGIDLLVHGTTAATNANTSNGPSSPTASPTSGFPESRARLNSLRATASPAKAVITIPAMISPGGGSPFSRASISTCRTTVPTAPGAFGRAAAMLRNRARRSKPMARRSVSATDDAAVAGGLACWLSIQAFTSGSFKI